MTPLARGTTAASRRVGRIERDGKQHGPSRRERSVVGMEFSHDEDDRNPLDPGLRGLAGDAGARGTVDRDRHPEDTGRGDAHDGAERRHPEPGKGPV